MLDKVKKATENDKVNEGIDKVQDSHVNDEKVNQGIDKAQEHLNKQNDQ